MSALKLPPPVVVRGGAASPLSSTLRATPRPRPSPARAGEPPCAAARPLPATPSLASCPDVPSDRPASAAGPPTAGGGPARRADSPLFRYEALRAYERGARLSTPLRVVPLSTRLLLLTLGALLVGAVGVASVGQIDLTARGRGVLRTSEGVQPLMLEIEGVVRALHVHEGDVVRAGQVLLRLDSTRLSAALREAEEQLLATGERTRRDDAQASASYRRDRALLKREAASVRMRMMNNVV